MVTYMLEQKIKGTFHVVEYSAWLRNIKRYALTLHNGGTKNLRITKLVGQYFGEGYHAHYLDLVDGKFRKSKS